ncbi:oxidoreductase, partial [Staphylococcus epidermidis]
IDDGGGEALGELRGDGDVVGRSGICVKSFGEEKEDDGGEMSGEEIEESIREFGEGSRRGIEGGFDGVEIDGGKDYVIEEFVCG